MSWLEHKYINLLSSRLDRFKRNGSNLYQFRCPICGDSEKNKSKSRGYIYEKNGNMYFHCHNCNTSHRFSTFLKIIDNSLYDEYRMERLKDERSSKSIEVFEKLNVVAPVFTDLGPIKSLRKITQISPGNPVFDFVYSRNIPSEYWPCLYACPNFMHFTNTILPGKFSENALKYDETRLLIPFLDENKKLIGFQGRTLLKNPDEIKYLTISLTDQPVIYGLDRVDLSKTLYVFEGVLDAIFIPNSIATAGGDLVSTVKLLPKENTVICYDNESRSIQTVNKIKKAILSGYQVCIWPESIPQKDVNEMIISGIDADNIRTIIDENTYFGLKARFALSQWAKTL